MKKLPRLFGQQFIIQNKLAKIVTKMFRGILQQQQQWKIGSGLDEGAELLDTPCQLKDHSKYF